ncbi:MAG: DegT/DnrJ/EryC1/StrS family aminotransferase [Planctomycetota bacterium]|jgi:dTDP-4-amino-4,6-dideoxygalactose transaminase
MSDPVRLVDVMAQHAEVQGELDACVRTVFETGAFVLGEHVAGFERDFADALGVCHAVGVNSGTDALVLALDVVRARRGRGEVITTPFTFFATAEAVVQAGHDLRFADIEPDTFNLAPAAVQAAAGPKTVAILPVHLFGQCADVDALRSVGDAAMIEDAAQSVGATYKGRPAGGLGDAAGFSFYVTKNLGAVGDAGAVTTNDAGFAEMVRSLRAHGEVRIDEGRSYHYERVGRNSRLDALQAAVLRVKLRKLGEWQERRAGNAFSYDQALAGIDGLVPPPRAPGSSHVYHQYVVRAKRRDGLREHLGSRQIETRVFYPQPLHVQPALADLGLKEGAFPEAERACREVLALPVHAHLAASDRERVVNEIRAFYGA